MRSVIEPSLGAAYDSALVAELLDAHEELKKNFHLGGLRLSAVEGGRFAEAAFRILEQEVTGTFTPLGDPLDTDRLIRDLATTQRGAHPQSVRLHIPRCLRVIYDVRNQRDAAHLADGIDPNVQDATLVSATADWVLAEFLRLHHSVSADEAQSIVEALSIRTSPAIQMFGDVPKVLVPGLRAGEQILLLLQNQGSTGATRSELEQWIGPASRRNLSRTLNRLVNEAAFAHFDGDRYFITVTGQIEADRIDLGSSS